MKPKTKRILIIVAAALAIAAIIYFAFFRKAEEGTAEGYIDRLDINQSLKSAIKANLKAAEAAEDIQANADRNGCNYQQALALTAAYWLVSAGTITEETWWQWKEQILAM